MATIRKIRCPYCKESYVKQDLIDHIDKEHEELLPEGFTAGRLVFKIVNKKDHGTCIVCKKETEWDEKRCKYNRVCSNPLCHKKLREIALKNHIKVYNKPTLLNDMDQQRLMLEHRKIAGTYKFKDGGKIGYVGSYEKNLLEFFDKVLNVESKDIIEPGPTFDYKDGNGITRKWITDFLYVPYNLVIEVKDGGSNPNKRNMPEYRNKQIMKQKMITDLGTVNYLRLTDNNFAQLMEIMADLRMQMIDDTNQNHKAIVRIHEDADILNEATNNNGRLCLPLDFKQIKNDQYLLCANTHLLNMTAQSVQVSLIVSAIITLLWGYSFIPAFLFNLKFQAIVSAATMLDQIFARDFAIVDKDFDDNKFNFSESLNGVNILSVADGEVVETKRYEHPYGNCIVIKHNGMYSLYAHIMENGIKVKKYQKVKRGQVIGLCGSTGNSTAPHLHFEMAWTKPGDTFTAIPKSLTNFENHKYIPLNVAEFLGIGFKNKKISHSDLYDIAVKRQWKNNIDGEIGSFCFMKK